MKYVFLVPKPQLGNENPPEPLTPNLSPSFQYLSNSGSGSS